MSYTIHGLDPAPFAPLFGMTDAQLAERRAVRVTATADHGFPCRVSLRDAAAGVIAGLLGDRDVAYVDAYNAAYGCFAARIERNGASG